MRPTYGRAVARVRPPHPRTGFPVLAFAAAVLLSACGDSTTAPNATTAKLREAKAFEVNGVTYPAVSIQGASATLAVGGHESLKAQLATPTATWMGQYMTWTSSNSAVVSVATQSWGGSGGDVGYLTGVANGTATITATTESGTAASYAITVGNNTEVSAGNGPWHEPAGMAAQINTGSMTTAPANNGSVTQWKEGTTTFSNFSPVSPIAVGSLFADAAANITAVPGEPGLRVLYPSTLAGGYSPVRFGTPIANPGTGYLYIRWKFRLSTNWTLSQALGIKVMEPRTGGENDVVSLTASDGSKDGADMWPQFLLQGTSYADLPSAPQGYTASRSTYLSTTANVGGSARGSWHTMELYIQPETSGGHNGQFTWWVDGTMVWTSVGHAAGSGGVPSGGIAYWAGAVPSGWNYLMFDPTYGGDAATDHPPDTIYWDIDELYVSTK
jgi:hypothetical protein